MLRTRSEYEALPEDYKEALHAVISAGGRITTPETIPQTTSYHLHAVADRVTIQAVLTDYDPDADKGTWTITVTVDGKPLPEPIREWWHALQVLMDPDALVPERLIDTERYTETVMRPCPHAAPPMETRPLSGAEVRARYADLRRREHTRTVAKPGEVTFVHDWPAGCPEHSSSWHAWKYTRVSG
ncbi:hypothetical protein ACFY97_18625 [Streptomyces klenkii]|uniref:hypothetical protein n=1 Tax=Streptomyces klenkii TaxID=1420899 RepID=UPI0036F0F520